MPVIHAYDTLSGLSNVKSEDGATLVSRNSYTYDGLSRKLTQTQEIPAVALTKTVTSGYDFDGNLKNLTYP